MPIRRNALLLALALGTLLLGGCAGLLRSDTVQVIVAGIEPLQGEGLELRMLVKLRIQNSNDQPLDFNGVSVQMDVQGKRFATGVSNAGGRIPRFGETVVAVPVSISVFAIGRQAVGIMTRQFRGKLAYEMTGKLAGPQISDVRFSSQGELALPAELFESEK